MSYAIRSILCNKIGQILFDGFNIGGTGPKPSSLVHFLKISQKNSGKFEYALNLNKLSSSPSHNSFAPRNSLNKWSSDFIAKFQIDSSVPGVYFSNDKDCSLNFIVNNGAFVKEVIDLVHLRPESFWKSSALFNASSQNIVVEFSSPNIAKPFHIGHLRSTIVGSFVSNILEAFGHKVTRLNYLGDWGLQIGLIKHALDLKGQSESDLQDNPLKKLYELYVWINQEASQNPQIEDAAKRIFKQMESQDKKSLQVWRYIKEVSLNEMYNSYRRLNVNFDEYHSESMYQTEECLNVLKILEEKDLLELLDDGRKVYKVKPKENVTILKSDGTPLYITRDLSAAIDRSQKYKFDKMIYVVDNSQQKHFHAFFKILTDLGYDWGEKLTHVSFGRIFNMSTRKGTAMFLSDFLDHAQEQMSLQQSFSENTKVSGTEAIHTADIVGISAVVTALLKISRKRDFNFDWKSALQSKGNTGVALQYVHCRLNSLQNLNSSLVTTSEEWDEKLLLEPEALELVKLIASFDEVLHETGEEFESAILLKYLFKLCKSINKAWNVLPVKNAPKPVAEARLKLFQASRLTLAAGMKIIGITPLKKM